MLDTVAPSHRASLSHELVGIAGEEASIKLSLSIDPLRQKKWARPGGVSFRGAGPASDQRIWALA